MPIRVRDDRGRVVALPGPPARIVSLVPSDTLNVAALGAGRAIVGRTDYCELPEEIARRVPSVGGTKNPRLDDVCDLEPDLVIANQEENTRADLEKLAQRGVRVLVAFPKRVAEGLAHLARLARVLGVEGDADVKDLVRRGYDAHRRAEEARSVRVPVRTFCPIWMSPLMTIHGATFISDMLDLCGAQNVFADRERRYPLAADVGGARPIPPGERDVRYPRVTLEEVVARSPRSCSSRTSRTRSPTTTPRFFARSQSARAWCTRAARISAGTARAASRGSTASERGSPSLLRRSPHAGSARRCAAARPSRDRVRFP